MSTKRKAESHAKAASRPRIMKSGGSRADSERDSGFSDASSEHMSTMDTADAEDSLRPVARQGPQPSPLAVVGSSYSNLSPMIIMNNVLIKQPGDNPPALKPWGFSPTVEVVQPVVQQPRVVFLQPVVSRQASPASSKEATSRHRRPKNYLPILKSYPKIAPHPGDSSSSSARGTASSSSSSSSASEKGSGSASSQREHCQREKQQRNPSGGGASSFASTAPSASSVPASPTVTSPLLRRQLSLHTSEASSSPACERSSSVVCQAACATSPSLTHTAGTRNEAVLVSRGVTRDGSSLEEHNHCSSDSDADTKRKRFCNTYNILSKSGLLDIALRTKELHRQNKRTQSDLEQLKKHTELFLQALWTGDTSICVKLQACLQEDGQEDLEGAAPQTCLKSD